MEDERIYTWSDVVRHEYETIIDVCLIVQMDDPSINGNWDRITPEPIDEDDRQFAHLRVETLNLATRDLPEAQLRFQVC